MHIREQKDIIITTNPKALRDLADKMERDFPKLRWGESSFIDIIGYIGQNTKIAVHAEQEYFHKLKENKC